jgi:hypothetical protein
MNERSKIEGRTGSQLPAASISDNGNSNGAFNVLNIAPNFKWAAVNLNNDGSHVQKKHLSLLD